MRCAGPLTLHARFEASGGQDVLAVRRWPTLALELLGADRAGIVVVGEAAGLVGASLRRSPALAGDAPDFEFPEIRRWLSFTPDRAFRVEPGAGGRRRGARADKANGAGAFLRPLGDGAPRRALPRGGVLAPPAAARTARARGHDRGAVRGRGAARAPPPAARRSAPAAWARARSRAARCGRRRSRASSAR